MSKLRNVTGFRGIGEEDIKIKTEPISPPEFSPCIDPDVQFTRAFDDMKLEPLTPNSQPLSRPSLSMSDLTNIRSDANIDLGKQKENRRDVMRRYSRKPSQTVSTPPMSRTKFVSMAEAIYHFQRDTPGRFHTTGNRNELKPRPVSPLRVFRTLPQSPTLRCATRARPMRLLTSEEREKLEIEEIRKHKIKAQPIPKAVLRGGHLPDVVRREKTVPEPFNLTEVPQRPPPQPEPEYTFQARPAPKHILEKAHVPPKPPSTVTEPVTPNFMKERARSHDNVRKKIATPPQPPKRVPVKSQKSTEAKVEVPHLGVGQSRPAGGPLRVEPFSFEKRDEHMRQKKEEKIKQFINEEKKLASQFKANPVPKIIKKKSDSISSKRSEASSTSSENKENFKFEAKPAVVLTKKPFKPLLTQTQVTESKPFALTTEKRAAERENFDRQLKEKEDEVKRLAEQRQREKQIAEERERARLRSQLVHHAQPVPDLVPFVPEKSNAPLTEPQTPLFVRRLKKAN